MKYFVHRMGVLLVGALVVVGSSNGLVGAGQESDDASESVDRWAPFRPFLGKWKGTGKVPAGDAIQETEWKLVMGGKFIQCRSTSKAEGDDHEDIGFISYDESRRHFVYRAFYSEGFVNQYVVEIAEAGKKIVFRSEAIENAPPGLRAMETVELKSGKLNSTLELATGDNPYTVCVAGVLTRVGAAVADR